MFFFFSGWSTDGCRAEFWNSTHTQCSCDHLTPFAVLVDVNDVTLEHGHFVALTVITIVGCVVSIVALVAAVLTFAFMPSLKARCDRTTIHKNLCICLLVAEVIFLAGIDATSHRVLCGVVAGLLHYFFLAAFCWMFCEGFQIYVLLVEVFQSERKRVGLYYWASYGLPLVVVGAAAAVDAESYGTPAHCWLRTDNYFAMSFFGPVLLVIACNLVFLAMGVFVVCRHFSVSASSKEQTRLSAHGQRLQGALAMVVLLGLTWTFGFMHVNEKTFVMAYVFTILNSLQGFFIFYFTCLRNEKSEDNIAVSREKMALFIAAV
ncbi:unnamed protein product [Notodromas monacha]|uniref:Uncharacterized protein n=1 Tax=Notodromas monacha TaxID=399045 RepID=A0A7R9BQI1_9CRUS|nr:unnamed protein product [Notodromas monacha]CAG0918313.1 unnamed protein product [Notodromas monacha]